ncbi:hypothetical protein ILYODFUR_036282 [Ilyodon furcidens]|uniref:Uncharacterized protein n=1 Tax=Ilyodon furcidens TaxID=33524 RepID=A0ABV0ST49_9TELE
MAVWFGVGQRWAVGLIKPLKLWMVLNQLPQQAGIRTSIDAQGLCSSFCSSSSSSWTRSLQGAVEQREQNRRKVLSDTKSWTLSSENEAVAAGSGFFHDSDCLRGPVSVPDSSTAQPDPWPAAGVSVRTEPRQIVLLKRNCSLRVYEIPLRLS